MSHEIFGERCLVRDKPAWHKLGVVIPQDEKLSVWEGFQRAKADYDVVKVAVPNLRAFGKVISTEQFALVRGPSGLDEAAFLGFVSKNYEPVTGRMVADILEPLAREWPLETVGALGNGERFFVTLKIGETVLNGSDRIIRYALISGNHANGRGVNIVVTTIRVVCNNTLEAALGNGSVISLPHSLGVEGDLSVVTSVIAKLHNADDVTVKTLERLALAKVTDDQVEQIIRAGFPDPTEPRKARFAREALDNGQEEAALHFKLSTQAFARYLAETEENRRFAHQCYDKINREFEDIAGTAWAALNAVTEVSNHRVSRGDAEESIVFGVRRTEGVRALGEAVRVADKVLA